MDRLSKVFMIVGGAVAVLAGCALESEGIYGYYVGIMTLAGMAIAGIGYGLHILAKKRWEREMEFYLFRQRARQDEDIIWIEEAR